MSVMNTTCLKRKLKFFGENARFELVSMCCAFGRKIFRCYENLFSSNYSSMSHL